MAVDKKIQVADYNDIRNKIVRMLGPGGTSPSGASDATTGYGQVIYSSEVSVSSKVKVSDWANLTRDLINVYKHQNGTNPSVAVVIENALVRYDTTTTPYPQFNSYFDGSRGDDVYVNRFKVHSSQAITTGIGTASVTYNAGSGWSSSLSLSGTITFPSAAAARYFFNGGGELRFEMSRSGGSASGQNSSWTSILSGAGTQAFGGNKPGTGVDPNNGQNYYRLRNSYDVWYSASGSSPYGVNTYRISARSPGIADNSSGTSSTIDFLFEFIDNYTDPGPPAPGDEVNGTFSLTATALIPYGQLDPTSSGFWAVSTPSASFGSWSAIGGPAVAVPPPPPTTPPPPPTTPPPPPTTPPPPSGPGSIGLSATSSSGVWYGAIPEPSAVPDIYVASSAGSVTLTSITQPSGSSWAYPPGYGSLPITINPSTPLPFTLAAQTAGVNTWTFNSNATNGAVTHTQSITRANGPSNFSTRFTNGVSTITSATNGSTVTFLLELSPNAHPTRSLTYPITYTSSNVGFGTGAAASGTLSMTVPAGSLQSSASFSVNLIDPTQPGSVTVTQGFTCIPTNNPTAYGTLVRSGSSPTLSIPASAVTPTITGSISYSGLTLFGEDQVSIQVTGPDAGTYVYILTTDNGALFNNSTGNLSNSTFTYPSPNSALCNLYTPHGTTTVTLQITRSGYTSYISSIVIPARAAWNETASPTSVPANTPVTITISGGVPNSSVTWSGSATGSGTLNSSGQALFSGIVYPPGVYTYNFYFTGSGNSRTFTITAS